MRRVLPYVPAAILVAVVLVQRVEMTRSALLPWMGAGFAMFTTSDDAFSRHVRCVASDRDGRTLHVSVAAPYAVPDAVRFRPVPDHVRPIALDLAWRRCDAPPELQESVHEACVGVWSHQLDRATATLRPRPLTEPSCTVTIRPGPEGPP